MAWGLHNIGLGSAAHGGGVGRNWESEASGTLSTIRQRRMNLWPGREMRRGRAEVKGRGVQLGESGDGGPPGEGAGDGSGRRGRAQYYELRTGSAEWSVLVRCFCIVGRIGIFAELSAGTLAATAGD